MRSISIAFSKAKTNSQRFEIRHREKATPKNCIEVSYTCRRGHFEPTNNNLEQFEVEVNKNNTTAPLLVL
jgi:hypothetical protein